MLRRPTVNINRPNNQTSVPADVKGLIFYMYKWQYNLGAHLCLDKKKIYGLRKDVLFKINKQNRIKFNLY